jgi:cellobiose phosphorylase
MDLKKMDGWHFLGEEGDFYLENPQNSNYLYFPLANEAGLMSSITPLLGGDIKTSQNTFLMAPVSSEDLHNSRSARNFWFYLEGFGAWSASGNSSPQMANQFVREEEEKVRLECGFLWHRVIRENKRIGIRTEMTSFVPATQDKVELLKVKITNIGKKDIKITPTSAIPVYGRSADNVRDHRHVTSLLHRIKTVEYGVEVKPALSFDERGHKVNSVCYGVLGAEGNGTPPVGFFPVVEEFIGEGGSFEWPEIVAANRKNFLPSGEIVQGYEAIGAIRFRDLVLPPESSQEYVLAMGIWQEGFYSSELAKKYCSIELFEKHLKDNKKFWQDKLKALCFKSGDPRFNLWLKWTALQPILRRIYGCSFLPHHDYGRGGRGWRDLWQDCLALLLMEPKEVRGLLLNNYAGVRMDGSNATIIGSLPGEFIADRNNISRVWMDHGAWPFLTTKLYLDLSGDMDFLLENQTYFKDRQISRSTALDEAWSSVYGNRQKAENGEIYRGSILEHILLQNVVQFFNVGEHNNILLEGADWNDALDMAREKGESVAFSAFYASNLMEINKLLMELKNRKGISEIETASEMVILFDTLSAKVDYDSVSAKRERLSSYYESLRHNVSGSKVKIQIEALASDLKQKSEWMAKHIREKEWIQNEEGFEWFNGYYDNKGNRVEGDFDSGVRMTLTGQTFAIMGNTATEEQVKKASTAVKQYLKDSKIGGYRLNTDFHELKLDLGRGFGFAFGHKENGAVFSHMAIMYANALYQRGFVSEGWDVLSSMYKLSTDFSNARIYPGIPEYINEKKRGMYHYLTGSASWLLLTVLTEVYGVKGRWGNLAFEPKLLREQFDKKGEARVITLFADRNLEICYKNPALLGYGKYTVKNIKIDGKEIVFQREENAPLVERKFIAELAIETLHKIEVELG